MAQSPKLGFSLLEANTNNKYVVHNDAIVQLETLAAGSAIDYYGVTAPPSTPAEGDVYIVPTGATGIWSSQSQRIARYTGTGWEFFDAFNGYSLYVMSLNSYFRFTGTSWQPSTGLVFESYAGGTTARLIDPSDHNKEIRSTSATFTVEIPTSASGFPIGWFCYVTHEASPANLTVQRVGGGTTSFQLYNNINTWTVTGVVVKIVYRGSNIWKIFEIT